MKLSKKPRLLLINPWIYDFSAFDLWSKPLGLLYIASYLRHTGYLIDYIDCLDQHNAFLLKSKKKPKTRKYGTGHLYQESVEKPEILKFLPRNFKRYGLPEEIFLKELYRLEKPAAILVTSLMTYWYFGPRRVVELVREVFSGVPVILGGIYNTLLPQHAREIVKPDYQILGAGEIKIARLLKAIIPDGPEEKTPPRDIDAFPTPAFDLYTKLEYLVVMSSRGCPYHCTFCATDIISGEYVQRRPDYVVEEILQGIRNFAVKNVAFYDDALLLNKKNRIIPILEFLAKDTKNISFHTPNGLHAREIDLDLAQLFFKTGFTTICLSFESISPSRKNDMKGKVSPEILIQAVENLEKAGYQRKSLSAYVLMGLPNQPFEEVYESILFINSIGIKINLASYSPIPGTVDYYRAMQEGLIPENIDPLLTNNTLYPLFRNEVAYYRFNKIRQLAFILNQGIDRGIRMTSPLELRIALKKFLNNYENF